MERVTALPFWAYANTSSKQTTKATQARIRVWLALYKHGVTQVRPFDAFRKATWGLQEVVVVKDRALRICERERGLVHLRAILFVACVPTSLGAALFGLPRRARPRPPPRTISPRRHPTAISSKGLMRRAGGEQAGGQMHGIGEEAGGQPGWQTNRRADGQLA